MSGVSGVAFLVRVNTGTEGSPVWTVVGGQRNATLNRSNSPIDTGSKDTAGWPSLIPGEREWSIDFDGLIIEGNAGYALLENAFINNTRVQVQLATPTNVQYQGFAILTDFPIEAPYDAEATMTGTLQGASALTRVV